MALQTINKGAAGNDHTGDPLRTAFGKCNDNFAELDARSPAVLNLEALEDLVAGDAIHLFPSGGALAMRKADASDDTRPCDGFVFADVAMGDQGDGYLLGGRISGFAAATFTPGDRFWLSTAAGGLTGTPPSGAGEWVQEVAIADTDTSICTYRLPGIGL